MIKIKTIRKRIILLAVTCLTLCSSCNIKNTQTVVLKEEWFNPDNSIVFLRKIWSPSFWFVLTSDKKLVTIKSETNIDFKPGNIVEVNYFTEKNLSEEEWQDIITTKDNLGEFSDSYQSGATDGWIVTLQNGDEELIMNLVTL